MSMKYDVKTKLDLSKRKTALMFDPEADKSITQQHHNDGGKLDTTKIISNYFKNGVITNTRDGSARYLDATAITDFREAMTVKARADQAFQSLPDAIRKKEFNNDPKEFVEFALNADNIDQLREWGLAPAAKTKDPVSPTEVIIVNPAPPEGEKTA